MTMRPANGATARPRSWRRWFNARGVTVTGLRRGVERRAGLLLSRSVDSLAARAPQKPMRQINWVRDAGLAPEPSSSYMETR